MLSKHIMILILSNKINSELLKDVDETTTFENVARRKQSISQLIAECVA